MTLLWISIGLISVVAIFLTGFLTWPPSIDFLSRRPSDIAEVRQGVEEMVREWEAQQPVPEVSEPYWAIDTTSHTPAWREGKLLFVPMKDVDGRPTLIGPGLLSDVAPADRICLVGDYDSCQDWMNCYGDSLREAVARRENRPTAWDRLREEAS